jgi:hypothetical protein
VTFNVDSVGALTSPCYLVIDPDNPAKREYVYFDGTFTSTTFVTTTTANRGLAGSTSGAQAHSSGAKVRSAPLAQHIEDLNSRIDTKATDSTVVHLAGVETITGAKTFSVDPTLADGSSALSLTEGNAAYEAKVSRTGATAGQVPTLQADSTLAFADVAAGGVSEGFRAFRSTAQALSAATFTTIVFDTEDRDEGLDYDNTTGAWTCPATGWYDVAAAVYYPNVSDGGRVMLVFAIDGTHAVRPANATAGAFGEMASHGAFPWHFTAGQVLTVLGFRAAAGDVSGGSQLTWFTVKRRYAA